MGDGGQAYGRGNRGLQRRHSDVAQGCQDELREDCDDAVHDVAAAGSSATAGDQRSTPRRKHASFPILGVQAAASMPAARPPEPTTPKRSAVEVAAPAALPVAVPPVRTTEKISEVQLTKNFLAKEIEARSLKLQRFRGGSCWNEELHKLLIISYRLPFTVILNEETGQVEYEHDPFDTNIVDLLATEPESRFGSARLSQASPVLVGAPVVRRKSDGGLVTSISEALQEQLDAALRADLNAVPVFTPPGRDFFMDWVIFPLFHYSLPSAETGMGIYDWEGYELVNAKFRDVVLKEYQRGDLVWINDYPLMLLPQLLRQERPDIPIGFYLHCVFPSPEVYRILPQREAMLRGILSSNIIGFHNFQYVQHFLTSCIHVLGLECTASGIEACEHAGGTHTKVITVPLGIRLEPYQALLNQKETRARIHELVETFSGKRLLVAVDRLEEKKGIRHKLMAYHKFLQKAPDWARDCVYVQIVEPADDPSEDAEGEQGDQQKLLQQVYQMVGEVNSTFGKIGHLPVHFLCQPVSQVDMAALCARAAVMIDTPLRDVIPHSAYTFLFCQQEKECGVLILSEFSGSAQSLRAAALCVNPWDTNAFADAIQEALEMDLQDRIELHRYGRNHVTEYTLNHWAVNFLDELLTAKSECENERLQIPPQLDHDKPVSCMRKAGRRLIILGFSGTLMPHLTRFHSKIFPKLPDVLLSNLQFIAEDSNTYLIVISSLPREALAVTLAGIPCWIIAEGGVCYREPNSADWHSSVEQRDTEWLAPVKEIMEYFAARTPGSNVLEMESSVSWLYAKTQGDHAAIQSKDLLIHLWAGPLLSAPAEVVIEQDGVNVKPTGVGKALQLERLLQQICYDDDGEKASKRWFSGNTLVLCVGDFLMRDEDVFVTVQKFFEPEGCERPKPVSTPDTDRWDQAMTDQPHWTEDINLEANSMSLGTGYNLLSQLERDEEGGPFGLHKSQLESVFADTTPLPKKVPSEPDLQVATVEPDSVGDGAPFPGNEDDVPGLAQVFTCTVSRKPTRASFHLSDTNDVAFLIAKLARELRQAKQLSE